MQFNNKEYNLKLNNTRIEMKVKSKQTTWVCIGYAKLEDGRLSGAGL